eukprot:15479861-Alexandrium_andersonii.AAC.1
MSVCLPFPESLYEYRLPREAERHSDPSVLTCAISGSSGESTAELASEHLHNNAGNNTDPTTSAVHRKGH